MLNLVIRNSGILFLSKLFFLRELIKEKRVSKRSAKCSRTERINIYIYIEDRMENKKLLDASVKLRSVNLTYFSGEMFSCIDNV